MEKLFALRTLRVVIIAAVITNINVIAILVDSKRNFISEEIFVALCAKQIFVSKATRTDIGTVVDKSHPASVVIFMTMLAEAVIFVETTFADVYTLAVAINDFPSFGTIILALLAELAAIVIAIVTEKFGRNFVGAGNTQSVGANIENLVVVLMVLTNGNFSVEVWMNPVRISAEAVPASDTNVMFVAAIFFSLPEIWNSFKLRKFTLNKVTIKFRFSLSPTGTAARVVKSTLKQKPVVRFIHEELTCGLAIVERFGFIRVGGSKNDESHVVTSVTGAPTVVIAIEDVEGVA